MKKIITQQYQCEKCGDIFDSRSEAVKCERVKINRYYDWMVKGKKVRIIKGEGEGEIVTIERVFIAQQNWGEAFHHSAVLVVNFNNNAGSRLLDYESWDSL